MRLTTEELGHQEELARRLRSEGYRVLDRIQSGLVVAHGAGRPQAKADLMAGNLGHISGPWKPGEIRYTALRTERNRWTSQADRWNLRRWNWNPDGSGLTAEIDPCHNGRIQGDQAQAWSLDQDMDRDAPLWQTQCNGEEDAGEKLREYLLGPRAQETRRKIIRMAGSQGPWTQLHRKLKDQGYRTTVLDRYESETLDLEPGDWVGTWGKKNQGEAEKLMNEAGFVSISIDIRADTVIWVPEKFRPNTRDKNRSARTALLGTRKRGSKKQ